jgi:hypothetical protein
MGSGKLTGQSSLKKYLVNIQNIWFGKFTGQSGKFKITIRK